MSANAASSKLNLRFPSELEAAFQLETYQNTRNFLRGISVLWIAAAFAQLLRFLATQPKSFLAIPLGAMACSTIILALSYQPQFWKTWQPSVALITIVTSCGLQFGAAHHIAVEPGYGNLIARVSWFSASTMMFMVTLAPIRLNYQYASLVYCTEALISALACKLVYGAPLGLILDRFSLGIFIVLPALIYLSYTHERLHRDAFLARQELAAREAAERARRQQTESMLSVLSHAIGGIVHDLGNPLTLVQSGLEVLQLVISKGDSKPATLHQVLDGVHSGAKMLNYLRISLIEQTRVLEGKPIPVALKPVMISALVEAGVRYQKPMFASQRRVTVDGDDINLLADEMKLVTVFMNLIGNALKYSDGEVRVSWQLHQDQLLVSVQDQGKSGHGLTREQAQSLFVAFGRLGTHEEVEGTGLGLLSVQKIVEAHGGRAYIEGLAPSPFSTSTGDFPSQLHDSFITAFVVVLPTAPPSS